MTQCKLIPYVVRVTKQGENDYLRIDDLKGEKDRLIAEKKQIAKSDKIIWSKEELERLQKADLFYILQKCLAQKGRIKVFEDNKKTISIDKIEIENRDLYGIIKSGEYGIGADFYDTLVKKITPNARKETDSEIYPFFFHFHIPESMYEGKVILQTLGVYGITTVLQRFLNECLDSSGYTVSFNQLISGDVFSQMEDVRIKEIQFIRKNVPKDITEKFYRGAPEDVREKRIYTVANRKNFVLSDFFKELVWEPKTPYYEILGERFSEVKAIITQSGSRRTLTFGAGEETVREELVLPPDIPQRNGHPIYSALLKESKEYMIPLTNTEKKAGDQ